MLKKLAILLAAGVLSACSMTSYIPFVNNEKPVIDLPEDKIDQKSYASAYEATVATYKGRVDKDYYVNSFASGAKDWFSGKILVPADQIKAKLLSGGGIDSNLYAYYSGVLHANALQTNFGKLSPTCWQKVDADSVTQGIYDAMRDLAKDKVRGENDSYIVQGSEQLLKACTGQ